MKQDRYRQWVKCKKRLRAKRRKSKKKKKQCYTKLYVIGNGFDLHHGIQSNYSDFKDFLEKNDPNVFNVVDTYLGNIENFWWDFEKKLACLDEDKILDHALNFLVSYGADSWSDANHHDYQYEISRIIDPLTTGLKQNFMDWILQIEIQHKKNQMLNLEKESLFLSFNYTSTLEKLYQMKNANIKHIHGKAINSDSDLILGHDYKKPNNKPDLEKKQRELGEEVYNEYLEELNGEDVRVIEGYDIINSYFTGTYKPTSDIIKENKAFFAKMRNVDEIIILGHSLGDVDIPYFEKRFKSVDNSRAKWTISYHNEKHIPRHRQVLKNIGIKDKQINNVRMDHFYPTKGILFG